jgi:hypothetical protein
MEPVEVLARFDTQGNIEPISYIWKKSKYNILSVGRRWAVESNIHILVMISEGQVFELIYSPKDTCWYLEPNLTFRKKV